MLVVDYRQDWLRASHYFRMGEITRMAETEQERSSFSEGLPNWAESGSAAVITTPFFSLDDGTYAFLLRLRSADGTNRLTRACVVALQGVVEKISAEPRPLVITGNERFFSAGAELEEIAALDGPSALEFSRMGQALMRSVEQFPAPVYAAISGYCMGGGLDLALACHRRLASPHAVFAHRGTALGLITGWGGTQRLPRLVGKAIALQMFVAAEKIDANRALAIGLAEAVVDDPVAEALRRIRAAGASTTIKSGN